MSTSTQVRHAIIRAFHDGGLNYEAIAELLGVGRATVSRVLRRHRESGTVEPKPRGGGNLSPIRGKAAERLRRLLADRPDLTIAEMAVELERAAKVKTSPASVCRALQRLGYTRKKRNSSRSKGTRPRI